MGFGDGVGPADCRKIKRRPNLLQRVMVRKLLAILFFQCILCTAFATNYLTFTAEEDGSQFGIIRRGEANPDIQYSLDDGESWTDLARDEITLEKKGDKALIRGNNPTGFSSYPDYSYFMMTGKIAASGSVMSLIDGKGETTTIPSTYCFYGLFYECASLTQAPELPATAMTLECYASMFERCTGLTEAPELPATTLEYACYEKMFLDCTSLTQAPKLPATTMKEYCYFCMFCNCTSLTQAPELPATTMDVCCYKSMFCNCTSLTQAPKLPATTMDDHCYYYMFWGCTSLTKAPELPATTLAYGCYENMFLDCTSLTQAPELIATELVDHCYYYMFSGCTNLSKIKVRFVEWETFSTLAWVANVASTGTFYCLEELPIEYGASEIPIGWNVKHVWDDDAVEDIANANTRVWTDGLNLYVRYAGDVEVYGLNGKQIYKGHGDVDSPMCLSMPAHGVYVVKMGGKVSKVEL